MFVRLATGSGDFGGPIALPAADSIEWLTAGDFDGDGRPDIAASSYSGGLISVFLNK